MKQKEKNRGYVMLVAGVAAIGGLLFGFDTGVISGALPFLKDHWGLSDNQQEWVTVSVLIGAIMGAAFSGRITDILGRKRIIIITAFIFAVGSIATGMAPNVDFLIFSRIILGLAIGITSYVVPLYISEIAPRKIRGALVSANQLMITIGILASYLSDYAIADENNPESWRWMFIVGFIPAVILFIGMLFLPESPRWLVMRRRNSEARNILNKLEPEDSSGKVYDSLMKDIILAKKQKASWKELFHPWMKYAITIGLTIMVVSQFTGINTVIYYSPTIFLKAGFVDKTAAIAASLVVGIINVTGTVISMLMIDKLGRRKLYFIGLGGMVFGLLMLGSCFAFQDVMGDWMKWFTVLSMMFYCMFFSVSLGPLCWLIISEVFPLRIRSIGMSISSMTCWIANALVAFTFLKMINLFGTTWSFWIYALVGIAGIVWGYFFIPETKGLQLETIEQYWKNGKRPRDFNKLITKK